MAKTQNVGCGLEIISYRGSISSETSTPAFPKDGNLVQN